MKKLIAGIVVGIAMGIQAQESLRFEYAPVFYHSRAVTNAVNSLTADQLIYEPEQGYLKSVLKALHISETSQVLVFKSTSFQKSHIDPKTPRAIYFNDTTYVGWIPGADYLEIIEVDPVLGTLFYVINQDPAVAPDVSRNNKDCLDCHSSAKTQSIPGVFIRSVYSKGNGRYANLNIYHQTPLSQRWGGWYVTGQTGNINHQGNLPEGHEVETHAHMNLQDLNPFFETKGYLTPHSDVLALMVLDHQCHMVNLFTKATYRVSLLLHDSNLPANDPNVEVPERVAMEVERNASAIVRYMLFTKEAELDGRIAGNTEYATVFQSRGPTDRQGRSLRDFDGEERLFKYPCSYLIYSANFKAMPEIVQQAVFQKLHDVLTSAEPDEELPHLTVEVKKVIYEILSDTLTGLPEYW